MSDRADSRQDTLQEWGDDYHHGDDYDHDHWDDDDWGDALVAGAIIGGTAAIVGAAIGSTYSTLPCTPTVSMFGGLTYYQCGQTYYQQTYIDNSVTYVVSEPPAAQ